MEVVTIDMYNLHLETFFLSSTEKQRALSHCATTIQTEPRKLG